MSDTNQLTTPTTPQMYAEDIPWGFGGLYDPPPADPHPDDDPLVDVLIDVEAYRAVARAAVKELANLTRRIGKLEEQQDHLRDQYRRLREQLVTS